MVGYKSYIDRFAANFDGVKGAIPHLKNLGVNYLHLIGVLKPRSGLNDGGFAIESYSDVNPAFGTEASFDEMVQALHADDIALSIDFVFNHTADSHRWARHAAAGDADYRDFYFTYDDRTEPDALEEHLGEVFPCSAPGNFVYNEEGKFWVWSTFHSYQWDLNYHNPMVFAAMLGHLLELANRGIDVFRMDAAAFLWKEPGTSCKDLPETHLVLQAFRWFLALVAPGCLIKAEAITAAEQVGKYFGADHKNTAREAQLSYHAPLMTGLWNALATENTQQLTAMMNDIGARPDGAAWLTYARCHDDIGWEILKSHSGAEWSLSERDLRYATQFFNGELSGSYARGQTFESSKDSDRLIFATNGTAASLAGLEAAYLAHDEQACETAVDRLLLLYSTLYAFSGVPMLFMGEEIGEFNDYNYTRRPVDDSRDLHRPDFDWSLLRLLERDDTDARHRLFEELCCLAKLRKQHLNFTDSSLENFVSLYADSLLCFTRQENGNRFVFLGNYSGGEQRVLRSEIAELLDGNTGHNILNESQIDLSADIRLQPYRSLWISSTKKTV